MRQAKLGIAVDEVGYKVGIGEPTFYPRKKKYGGPDPVEMRRLVGFVAGALIDGTEAWQDQSTPLNN